MKSIEQIRARISVLENSIEAHYGHFEPGNGDSVLKAMEAEIEELMEEGLSRGVPVYLL